MRAGRWALATVHAALACAASAAASPDYLSHCNGNGRCAVVSADGSRVVFPFHEELRRGAGEAQIYEWADGALRPLLPVRPYPPEPPPAPPTYVGLAGTSADGTHVFVESGMALDAADVDGGGSDTFDLHDGAATLLSVAPVDSQSGPAAPPLMWFRGASADGSRVYFDSTHNLVQQDTDGCFDVYERFAGQTTLLSTGPTATSEYPPHLCDMAAFDGVSADNSHVFFRTSDRLVPEDEGGDDIYERIGAVARPLTTYPEPSPENPVLGNCVERLEFGDSSADGRAVLFATNAPVSAEDTDETQDVYRREPDGSFSLVSRAPNRPEEYHDCSGFPADLPVALSADGRTAIFSSSAAISPADRDLSHDLYRAAGSSTELVTTGPTDPNLDEQPPIPPLRQTAVSEDARRVAFVSSGALVAADEDDSQDVYLRVEDRTVLVSTGPKARAFDGRADLLGMSADGRSIAFATGEALAERDTDRKLDFYLWREGRREPLLISAESIAPRIAIARNGRVLPTGALLLRLTCPDDEVSGPCAVRVKAKIGRRGRLLGKDGFRVAAGKRRWVRLPLRRWTQGRRLRRAFVVVRGADRLGNAALTRRRVSLSGPRLHAR